ncbi:MAG: protein-L-isoaspartate(D-aspartate) O-methyltransferase [Desulfofustis sp.]|nr:protein-L-isoaspartate(D-aspartate) O-methyltransferase [Desulfofustis sp.]
MANLQMLALALLFLLSPLGSAAADDPQLDKAMQHMLAVISGYGMKDTDVLQAMERVPRHDFVPDKNRRYSYQDTPLAIGYGQTISQPYIVAEMTRQLQLTPTSKVLEIGTGSGYQAAVLAELTPNVYSIEIIEPLLERARNALIKNGYSTIHLRHGDGYYGWPDAAPFDGIIVTCAAGEIPPPLVEQLAAGGRMLIPVGKKFGTQYLILVTKDQDGSVSSKNLMAVRFVPLVRK